MICTALSRSNLRPVVLVLGSWLTALLMPLLIAPVVALTPWLMRFPICQSASRAHA